MEFLGSPMLLKNHLEFLDRNGPIPGSDLLVPRSRWIPTGIGSILDSLLYSDQSENTVPIYYTLRVIRRLRFFFLVWRTVAVLSAFR